jgi:acyl carrier protein
MAGGSMTMTLGVTIKKPSPPITQRQEIAPELEQFIRARFEVADDDTEFGPDVDLWEEGYVDSAGVIEVVSHLEERWQVKIPEQALFDPRFTTIRGMAEVIEGLARG